MGWFIHGGDVVLSDTTEPIYGDEGEPDGAARKMTLRVSTRATALGYVDLGDGHPDHANLYAAGGKVTRERLCGHIYDVEFTYKGLLASKSPIISPNENLEGWDTATETRLVFAGDRDSAYSAKDPGDSLSGYGNMICVGRHAEPIIEGKMYKAYFDYRGFLTMSRPVKYIPRGWAEKQSMEAALYYSGQVFPVPLESNQPVVGLTVIYASTSVPNCALSGTNQTPPDSFGVPTNYWATIPNPTHVDPSGWVLDSREPDILAGTSLCLVTDQYSYYQQLKPG